MSLGETVHGPAAKAKDPIGGGHMRQGTTGYEGYEPDCAGR